MDRPRAELRFGHEIQGSFENTVDLEASPEAVFDTIADGEIWPRWFDEINRAVWTSPEPRGYFHSGRASGA